MQAAAYANGTLAHALDWDNTWNPLNHPTSPTLPAILAIAEYQAMPGRRVIEAIAVAFEVQGRLRLASTGLRTGRGFHKPGTTGIFGAVAGAAKLLDLTHDQLLMALGLAGSRAGSLSLNTGTMTKSSHSGHAARMGVECALLAKMGWTATAAVFDTGGFFDTFLHGDARPELLIQGFAAPLRMVDPGVGFKKYPSNYFTHRPIDAALALRQAHQIDPDEIEHVEVRFPRFEYVDRPSPRTGLDGKFSVQYTTTVALIDGEITTRSFTDQRRFAADVERLLPRVRLVLDDDIPKEFDETFVTLTVRLRNGHAFSHRLEKLTGWVGFPLTRDQRLKKFFVCVRDALDASQAERVVELSETLPALETLDEVMAIIRGATRLS
jgi:aconitate decarboxylase